MAAAEVMIEPHEIKSLQHGYVHTKAAPVSDAASTMSRTLPPSILPYTNENVETSPASTKSKQSTQYSTSDASQYTHAGRKDWSPPSTAFSSQEQLLVKDAGAATEQNGRAVNHVPMQDPFQSTSSRASTGSPVRPDVSHDMITERKRTASGQSKRASISSIHDLKVDTSPCRSRTSTLLSTTSNVSEACPVLFF